MEPWQQRAEREDPYADVPFHDGRRLNPDALVGLLCLAVGLLGVAVEIVKRVF